MDCERAIEILLEAEDGSAPAEASAEVEAHCDACPKCARLRAGLASLAAAPEPTAPPGLVDTILSAIGDERGRVAAQAAALEAAAQTTTGGASVRSFEPARMPARWRWYGWERRFAGFAAAAAIIIVGLVVVGLSLPRVVRQPGTAIVESAQDRDASKSEQPAGVEAPPENAHAGAEDSETASAPPYVTLEGMVFAYEGVERTLPSSLATAGVIVSALDDQASAPATLTALAEHAEPSPTTIWLQLDGGRVLRFRLVTRTYAGDAFALESGSPIARFGEWPTLPTRFARPTSADGSPSFRYFGSDDRGVRIYVPVGVYPLDGFSVPPGTAPDDPAAGNPDWTWWVRFD